MKVIAVNGSPREKGNTYVALRAVLTELEQQGIEGEIVHIGAENIRGCTACGGCAKTGTCVYAEEAFQRACDKIFAADGILLGSPVYFAGVAGTMKAFLDRLFYIRKDRLRHKVGAALAVSRRAGDMTTVDDLNKYFLISEMIVAPSYYWNVVHGGAPGEVLEDKEGISILSNLGRNMAWIMKMKEATKDSIPTPIAYPREKTSFIR